MLFPFVDRKHISNGIFFSCTENKKGPTVARWILRALLKSAETKGLRAESYGVKATGEEFGT